MTRSRARRAGFTLVEVLFAAAIGVMVSAGLVSSLWITAREQRMGMTEQRVFQRADLLEDRISAMLRGASRSAGVFLTDPSGAFFHTIVFRIGSGPGFANQSLSFNPTTDRLTYDPDMSVSGDEQILAENTAPGLFIEDVLFQTGLQTGDIPDSAAILVRITVSDRGFGRGTYRYASDPVNWIQSTRTFAVNLRRR